MIDKIIDIRQVILELEQQKPKNIKEFEFREGEIKRYLDLLLDVGCVTNGR